MAEDPDGLVEFEGAQKEINLIMLEEVGPHLHRAGERLDVLERIPEETRQKLEKALMTLLKISEDRWTNMTIREARADTQSWPSIIVRYKNERGRPEKIQLIVNHHEKRIYRLVGTAIRPLAFTR